MSIKALAFDFDGTLADTLPAITVGVNSALRLLGHPTHTEKEVRGFINRGARELIRGALPERYRNDEDYITRAFEIYKVEYAKCNLLTKETYRGVDALVAELHKTYRVGVLSNKPHDLLVAVVGQVLPAGSVDAVVGVGPNDPIKPDPRLSRKLTDALGVDPAECIMIGDSDVDLLTAKNAGMKHIGVAWGYRSAEFLRDAGARRVANTVAELQTLIQGLAN